MILPQGLLSDVQCSLEEWLYKRVEAAFAQVGPCPVEQICCLRKHDLVLLDQRVAHLNLLQIPKTQGPARNLFFWRTRKDSIHRPNHTFCPLALLLWVH